MKNRLAVGADQRDAARRDAEMPAGGQRGFGEDFSQAKIELAQCPGGDGLLLCDAQDFFLNPWRELDGSVVEQFAATARDACEGHFDGVGGSARNEAENE